MKPRRRRAGRRAPGITPLGARRLASVRSELARRTARAGPARWNADPQDVQRAVLKLVLTLVELLRRLFEKQALRRLEAGTLTPAEIEALGLALMRLETTVRRLARRFRIPPDELNLDLGPLGRLM
ncbi:MAG TPA: gas vesicle protein K [Solirubrobacteraceae bacterium]|nr:gas vesicle protein K [Solirubrobacteraceae bacterium]